MMLALVGAPRRRRSVGGRPHAARGLHAHGIGDRSSSYIGMASSSASCQRISVANPASAPDAAVLLQQ